MTHVTANAQLRLPRVDTHAHVFTKALPLVDGRRYAPSYDATLDTYRALLDKHDIGNAVLVQPSFLGTDNSFLLKALANDRERLRGVAVVSPDISEESLTRLSNQGVAGIRLNLVGKELPDLSSAPHVALWKMLSKLDWHVELHREATDLAPLIASLLNFGLPVVVDHFGRPDPDRGTSDPGFKDLLGFGDSGRVWVKISATYRCTRPGSDFVREATGQLIDAFGVERMMWGSDWPHTQYERIADFRETLSTLIDSGLKPPHIEAILRTTPYSLYGFDADLVDTSAPAGSVFQPSDPII
jgi:predicted TIM-barrel fold metal-dependent hydrolase